jgi:hypothetical protein
MLCSIPELHPGAPSRSSIPELHPGATVNPSSNIVILPLFHRLPLTTAGVALSKRTLDLDVARLSQDDLVPVEDVVRQVTQARQTEEGTYMFQTQDVNLLAQEVARALEEERQNEYDMFSPDVCPCSDPGSS